MNFRPQILFRKRDIIVNHTDMFPWKIYDNEEMC